ncbi:MAG TPA: family 10 glycosylhydrolase, partial [Vicinamibacteria bacterium]|nr:family 10 glycosylhydrolase [Vicinamibacteria bacterium]
MTASLALLLAAPLAVLPLTAHGGQVSTPEPVEMRGVWVVRTAMVSPEAVDRAVEEAARAGYNALFVQVRGRGDAFYRSSIVPRSELLRGQPAGFDPLARLLEGARARGLQVHAWVNVLLTAGFDVPLARGHVLAQHPEWAMVPRASAARALRSARQERLDVARAGAPPAAEGHYLSPAEPAVGAHLETVVRELVAGYAVDGLHLDFIRYPSPEYDWSPAALRAFRARVGKGWLLDAPERDPEAFAAFHRQALDGLVARLSR